MVFVPTVYIYNVKRITTVINNNIEYTRDKWIGNYDSGLEKSRAKYFMEDMKL